MGATHEAKVPGRAPHVTGGHGSDGPGLSQHGPEDT